MTFPLLFDRLGKGVQGREGGAIGEINTIVWQVDLADLASLDKYQQNLNADEGYWAILKKSEDLFVEGSIHDKVFDTL